MDFEAAEAKIKAIAMSEKNLDGRRLLIKDGELLVNHSVVVILRDFGLTSACRR